MNKRVAKILAQKKFYKFGIKIQAGRIIPIYWDPKAALSNPQVLRVVAQEFAKTIKKIRPKIEIIAGGATGGISLAAATSLQLNIPWVYIRSEPKGYSTNILVEGDYKKGARAVLVDDVIGTGKAKEIFIKNSKSELSIKDIIVILDDMGGNYSGWIKKNKIRIHLMFTKCQRDDYFYMIGFFNREAYELEKAYEVNRNNWHEDKKLWQKFLNWKGQCVHSGKL